MPSDPLTTTWVSSRLVVGASHIEGTGLFLDGRVDAGTVLVRFGGRVVSDDELRSMLDDASRSGDYVDTMALDAGRHLFLDDSIARFGNHSCNPTGRLDDPLTLVARRDLAPGTELTVDYATLSTLPEFSMRCRCGAADCRSTVTGNERPLAGLHEAGERDDRPPVA